MRVLITAAMIAASPAYGLDYEIAIGRSEYSGLQDGIWWQSPLGFNGHTRVQSFEIGARKSWNSWSVHGAYLDLGNATGDNLAVVPDSDYNKPRHAAIGRFVASQKVSGVLFGGAYRWKDLQLEAGHFAYRADWEITIDCPTGCGGHVRQNYETFRYQSGIRLSPYVAISYHADKAFITWRRFSRIDGGGNSSEGQYATGLTNGPVNQVMIGVKF